MINTNILIGELKGKLFILLLVLLLAGFTTSLYSNGLEAEVTIEAPDGDYFIPGDELFATLRLTDDEGNFLRLDEYRANGLRGVEMWVSGPRQDYYLVQPYENYVLLDHTGFNYDTEFDPETGEIPILLPNDLYLTGTYTLLFEVIRRANREFFSALPMINFQVGQAETTETESVRYITCYGEECHETINADATHTAADLKTCAICHTHDYEFPWNGFIHNFRCHDCVEFEPVNTCHLCHLANAGIDRFSHTGCFMNCHSYEDTPEPHLGYTRDMCIECHVDTSDVYVTHEEFTPQPPEVFDLREPEDNALVVTSPAVLSWTPARDADQGDLITYLVELGLDEKFQEVMQFSVSERTTILIPDLEHESRYWWRVKAIDLNAYETYSRQSWTFRTFIRFDVEEAANDLSDYHISDPYPNPFNTTVNVLIGLPHLVNLSVSVHDLTGREVALLVEGTLHAGYHQLSFETDGHPSGIYLIRLNVPGEMEKFRKVLLIR